METSGITRAISLFMRFRRGGKDWPGTREYPSVPLRFTQNLSAVV